MNKPMSYDTFFKEAIKLEAAGVDVLGLVVEALRNKEENTLATLDAKMSAAGMTTISSLLYEKQPIDRFKAHAGVKDLDSFELYLVRKYRQFLLPRIKQQLDNREDDDMMEWYVSHCAAYNDILINYRQAKERSPDPHVEQLKTALRSVLDDIHKKAPRSNITATILLALDNTSLPYPKKEHL